VLEALVLVVQVHLLYVIESPPLYQYQVVRVLVQHLPQDALPGQYKSRRATVYCHLLPRSLLARVQNVEFLGAVCYTSIWRLWHIVGSQISLPGTEVILVARDMYDSTSTRYTGQFLYCTTVVSVCFTAHNVPVARSCLSAL
jgi:hypothetical protein